MIMNKETGNLMEEGHDRALELIRGCTTPDGFLASPSRKANYRRIWSRDSVIIGMAALMSGEGDLIECFRRSLETLAAHQGPHGEIPSNVDTVTERISYGGTTGRVDADLWFVIGCGEYHAETGHDEFLKKMRPFIDKVLYLLGAWEFNNRGLLYIPETGDWADEYIHNGYVLYDQLLYLRTLETIKSMDRIGLGFEDEKMQNRCSRLRRVIRANYWFSEDEPVQEDVYHEVLYRRGREVARGRTDRFWTPFFSPFGYGYRFDALANIMASLSDVANNDQRSLVDTYIREKANPEGVMLLPAFHPVIRPVDHDWQELHTSFSYKFKNRPFEYHNGGLWPMITGFYVADLARRGRHDLALQYLEGIHRANALEMAGEPWSFPEYIHGKTFQAGGTRQQGWSAAAAIIGHHALEGRTAFSELEA